MQKSFREIIFPPQPNTALDGARDKEANCRPGPAQCFFKGISSDLAWIPKDVVLTKIWLGPSKSLVSNRFDICFVGSSSLVLCPLSSTLHYNTECYLIQVVAHSASLVVSIFLTYRGLSWLAGANKQCPSSPTHSAGTGSVEITPIFYPPAHSKSWTDISPGSFMSFTHNTTTSADHTVVCANYYCW